VTNWPACFTHWTGRSLYSSPAAVARLFLAKPFWRFGSATYATAEVVAAFRVLVIAFVNTCFAVPVSSILTGTGLSGLPARFAWLAVFVIVVSLVFWSRASA
jgi:hypothetical protein